MRVAVVGGKLQGVEVVYLAKKAGWQTLLIDKNPDVPATGLCDQFLQFEFTGENLFFVCAKKHAEVAWGMEGLW